jgi:hypothetical protein
MYIGHYGLLNSNQARQKENAMLEYRFPRGQFRRHDPLELVEKHSIMISITWSYAYKQWDHELPFENSTTHEEV